MWFASIEDSSGSLVPERNPNLQFLTLIPRYLTALAVTVGVYCLYGFAIGPLLEGPPRVFVPPSNPRIVGQQPDKIKEALLPYCPKDGWERQPCTILATPQAKIMFQDHKVLEDGSIELKPLSMFIRPELAQGKKVSEDSVPVIMRAPVARLKFERPMAAGSDMGELQHGELMGKVEVYRPSSGPGKEDGISLSTVGVEISPERIFTDSDCEFRFGKSYGRGSQLTIDLMGPKSHTKNNSNAFSGIERVELARLYELYLHRETSPEKTQFSAPKPPGKNDLLGNTSGSFLITSKGPMHFDFQTKTVSFQEQVLVRPADNSGDQLTCEKLNVVMADTATPNEEPGKLKVQRLWAAGTTQNPARIVSHSRGAELLADAIDYDLGLNQVELTSSEKVILIRDGQRIESKEIRYRFTEDGRMGDADILGPGSLTSTGDKQGKGEIVCRWQKQLKLRSDGDKKWLTLDQGNLKMDETLVQADQMDFWIWEVPQTNLGGGKTQWQFEPAMFRATGQVTIESPELIGSCNTAEAFWPQPANSQVRRPPLGIVRNTVARPTFPPFQEPQPAAPAPAASAPATGRPLQDLTDPPLTWRRPPGTPQQPATSSSSTWRSNTSQPQITLSDMEQKKSSDRSTRFVGNKVELQMRGGQQRAEVAEMTVTGDVVIQQQQRDAGGQQKTTMEFRGDQLQVESQPQDRYRLAMTGKAGRQVTVWLEELRLQGDNIFLDQMENQLWVRGPGRMRMTQGAPDPANVPSLRNTSSAAEPKILAPGDTTVTWEGGMVFNGSTLYFETNVLSESRQTNAGDGSVTATATRCAGLSITLNRAVDFAEMQSADATPDIEARRLIMVGRMTQGEVEFGDYWQSSVDPLAWITMANYDSKGAPTSRQEIQAPRITYDALSSSVQCDGRGKVVARQNSGSKQGLAVGAPTTLTSPGSPSGKVDYILVEYDDSFTGNLDPKKHQQGGRRLEFQGNVHAFYTQAMDWETQPTERILQQPGNQGMVMDCDLLTLDQWTPQGSKPTIDMVATGNARINGSQFKATAERISFSQSNVLVVLDAPIRANVEIWYADPRGGTNGHAIAKTVTYNIETGECQWQEGKQIDYSQQGPLRGR
ncbi:MAG: hypothetical protein GY819_02120 [Planctomycetaceae bacterium]|nr:hypothetical protein [Planctomycetaceae bacterium]MDG1807575.1 hypothetical protein [Pirellulaceae bacterium]